MARSLNLQSYTNFHSVLNFNRDSKRICIFLTLCYLIYVQALDMDSTVCRCTTKSKFGKPFVVLWNSPTEGCHVNFSVNIELEKHGILTNSNQTWDGEVVTVFYNGQLGLYPFYRNEDKKRKYNAGLPQVRCSFPLRFLNLLAVLIDYLVFLTNWLIWYLKVDKLTDEFIWIY